MDANNNIPIAKTAAGNGEITIHSPRKVYLIVAITTAAILGTMLFFMHVGKNISTKYSPLTGAILKLKLYAAQSHLWLEEYLEGDDQESLETVWDNLDKTLWYGQAMLQGGENELDIIRTVEDPVLRQEIEITIKKINTFRDIASERVKQQGNYGIGSEIDQKFDKAYKQLINQADNVEITLITTIKSLMIRFRAMQLGLIIATIILSLCIIKTFHTYELQRNSYLFKLQDRENHLRAIYQSVSSIAVIPASLDGPDAKIIDFNPGAERMFGYKKEAIIGKKVSILHKAIDVENFQQMQDDTKIGSQIFIGEFEMIRKNGKVFPATLTLYPRFDVNHKQIGVTGVVTDITKQKNFETQIQQYTDQLQSMVNERTVELEDKNARLQETYDKQKQSQSQIIQSEKMATLGMLLASVAHEINNPLGAIIHSNTLLKASLQSVVDALPIAARYFANNDGLAMELLNDAATSNVFINSSKKREIKKQMHESLANKVNGEVSIIIYKLMDIGITDNYEKYIPLINSEYGMELLDLAHKISVIWQGQAIIEEGTEKTEKIVSALKDYVHSGQSEEKISTDINHTIETVLTLFGNIIRHGIELKLDLQELPAMPCYPHELNQVWTNLVQNAIHAMNECGTMEINSQLIDNNITVTISDSGCGIPKEIQSKIFEPLFTTKPAGVGSGIGLDIVKQIIEKHHGRISVKSMPGEGAVFTVTLPVSQP